MFADNYITYCPIIAILMMLINFNKISIDYTFVAHIWQMRFNTYAYSFLRLLILRLRLDIN